MENLFGFFIGLFIYREIGRYELRRDVRRIMKWIDDKHLKE